MKLFIMKSTLLGCHILVIFFHLTNVECEKMVNELQKVPLDFIDGIINSTLESLRPNLACLNIKNNNFETGLQEFGDFKGSIKEVVIKGLDEFYVKILKTSFLDINNLTLVEDNFNATGFYQINGTLAFPLGKNDIHLFGNGHFSAKFQNFYISIKVKIRFENGNKVVRDLDIHVGLEKMQVYFKNLMGGGNLEKVFNQLINDVGLTVFNYYKEPVLNIVKPAIKKIITEMLNNRMESRLKKEEL